MIWSILPFGKHSRKTLPEVLFSDPDWFFWAIETGWFDDKPALRREATALDRKARNIKIPPKRGLALVVEYVIDPLTGRFSQFHIIPADRPVHEGASPTRRKDRIDMSFPRSIAPYDKSGYKQLLSALKFYVFGNKNARMSKIKCEGFFDDPRNFL